MKMRFPMFVSFALVLLIGFAGDAQTPVGTVPLVKADLESAHKLQPRIASGINAEEVYAGTTTSQLSTDGLMELRTSGHTTLTFFDEGVGGATAGDMAVLLKLMAAAGAGAAKLDSAKEIGKDAVAMGGAEFTVSGTLTSVEKGIVPVSILVNNVVTALPARHIRGLLTGENGNRNADMYVLDDLANPILLQFRVGEDSMTVVRIDWPSASTARSMETALAAKKPVDIYGIYFAYNSAELRSQSDSTLDAIAAMMKRDPTWQLTVTGHTDNVGGDAANLRLSQRRSAAVKAALVARGISAARLATGGAGASSPKATNATLVGRAQNRRVELSRQWGLGGLLSFEDAERYGVDILLWRLRMSIPSQKVAAIAAGFFFAVFANGCGANPGGPLDPALSGKWVLPGVDTYSMFILQQRGTVVTGTFGDYTGNQSFSEVFTLAGSADLPHVVLSWKQGEVNETFDATLSAGQDSLIGVIEPGDYATTFLRERPIEGRVVAASH